MYPKKLYLNEYKDTPDVIQSIYKTQSNVHKMTSRETPNNHTKKDHKKNQEPIGDTIQPH